MVAGKKQNVEDNHNVTNDDPDIDDQGEDADERHGQGDARLLGAAQGAQADNQRGQIEQDKDEDGGQHEPDWRGDGNAMRIVAGSRIVDKADNDPGQRGVNQAEYRPDNLAVKAGGGGLVLGGVVISSHGQNTSFIEI